MFDRKSFLGLAMTGAVFAAAGCATAPSAETLASRAEGNRAAALAFTNTVFNEKRIREGFEAHVGEAYIQHNPLVPDGRDGAIGALGFMLGQNPEFRYVVRRSIAEGDLVVLHVEAYPSPKHRGEAIVDIFRFDANGKIVEHWDVIQPVPETARNTNTMF